MIEDEKGRIRYGIRRKGNTKRVKLNMKKVMMGDQARVIGVRNGT